jgi:hypothetical protein
MLNSTVIEVSIGLVFCFASVALITSSIFESFATLLNLRAKILFDGIIKLLNANNEDGKQLLLKIYNHAMAHPTGDGTANTLQELKNNPSYIDSKHFAIALIESIQSEPNSFSKLGDDINAISDAQTRLLLRAIYNRANNDPAKFELDVAAWFNSAMDRISGTYKRKSQLWCFVISFLFAALFNIDSIHLFSTLWAHPSLVDQIAISANPSSVEAIKGLNTLPIGWESGFNNYTVIGWLVTAAATLFGAPFWFDLLKQIVQLRGTGKKPA